MATNSLSHRDIKLEKVTFDAKNKVLGRLASDIAKILMGKNKPNFVPYLDNGDYVVVTNAAQVKVTGRKEEVKTYARHSGYPGGFKSETLSDLRKRRPEAIIVHAVKGMLPHNKLGRQMIKKLTVLPAGVRASQAKVQTEETAAEEKKD